MKLAEALSERADIQKRIQQLRSRLRRNALVQEGEKPAEDPHALLEEVIQAADALDECIPAGQKGSQRFAAVRRSGIGEVCAAYELLIPTTCHPDNPFPS